MTIAADLDAPSAFAAIALAAVSWDGVLTPAIRSPITAVTAW
jgi:hypothetical protein